MKWFALPFSSDPHLVRTLLHDPSILGVPSFIELDKFLIEVISLVSSVTMVSILFAL